MKSSEIIKAALAKSHKTQVELAEHMGMSRQKINYRILADAFSIEEFEKVLEFCGYKLNVVDKDDLPIAKLNNDGNKRIVQMVGGKVYDTAKSQSLCSAYMDSQKNLKVELFADLDNSYFLTFWPQWGGKPQVMPLPKEAAASIIVDFSGSELSTLAAGD